MEIKGQQERERNRERERDQRYREREKRHRDRESVIKREKKGRSRRDTKKAHHMQECQS